MANQNQQRPAFIAIILLFFFWGFVAASNGVLIPMFKKNFSLTQFQSQLVDSAFYLAYFVGSLIYFLVSLTSGDPLNKIGYKKGLILGLLISACGALLFIPAVNTSSYIYFLVGLFIIALGFALLQIVANPFVINLGDASKGSHRLNLAGGINSLGTTLGPVLLAYALYGKITPGQDEVIGLDNVKAPYVVLSVLLIGLAVLMAVVKLPKIAADDSMEKKIGALQYPQLVLGMIAIFVYVGTEVTIPSNLGALLGKAEIKGIDHTQVDKYISLYWGSLMIGRMTSTLRIFNVKGALYGVLSFIIPFAIFGIVLGFSVLRGAEVNDLLLYSVWIVLFVIIKFIGQEKPAKTLVLFSITAILLLLVGLFTNGDLALYSIMSGGLFLSVMWPCIFNLAIAGLGKYTNQGSALLIMMILGGAVIPPIQGALADMPSVGIHASYWVPVAGFIYLAWYGFTAKRILQKQGIDYDATIGSGH